MMRTSKMRLNFSRLMKAKKEDIALLKKIYKSCKIIIIQIGIEPIN